MPIIKTYLLIINQVERDKPNPRIKTLCVLFTTNKLVNFKLFKQELHDLVIDAIKSDPEELREARTNPAYKILWDDIRKIPKDILAKHNMKILTHKTTDIIGDVIPMNVDMNEPFDISELLTPNK